MSTGRERKGNLASSLDFLQDHSLKSLDNFGPINPGSVSVSKFSVISGPEGPTSPAVHREGHRVGGSARDLADATEVLETQKWFP